MIYDVEIENTLKNMRDDTGFFKSHEDPERGWKLNNCPFKMLCGLELEIKDKEYNATPGIQKVFTDTSYITAKSMNDMEKLVFRDMLQKIDYYKRLPTKIHMSGPDRYNKIDLDKEVTRSLNLDTKLNGEGIEKKISEPLT